MPWQQTSRGSGEVVALDPQERPQTIKATAKGIVKKIADNLYEGRKVEKDEFLLEIQPFAGDLVMTLRSQLEQLKLKEETTLVKINAYENTVQGWTEVKEFAVKAAEELAAAAKAKLDSKEKLLAGYRAKALQAKLNYKRQKELFEVGAKSEKEKEKTEKEKDVAASDVESVIKD
ncbi:MAG: hypothetical protein AAF939_12985, partial [Planctomycetota bacterium]